MKKNAFTLIELIAVIVILSIVLTLSVPSLIGALKNNKEKSLEKINELIILAAKDYVVDYGLEIPRKITQNELCKNYLDCPIINPVTKEEMFFSVIVDENKNYTIDKNELIELKVVLNGGKLSKDISGGYTPNTEIILETPTRERHGFAGWEIVSGDAVIEGSVLKLGTKDSTLVANWVGAPVKLNVDLDGGTSSINYNSEYYTRNTLDLGTPTKENYLFLGWKLVSGDAVLSGNKLTFGLEDVSVKATWLKVVEEYAYTSSEQTFTAPSSGYYKLEAWGAQGGSYNSSYYGGYGGYSTGIVFLNKNEQLKIYVGSTAISPIGGYNGGGKGSSYVGISGGGGATHIARVSGLLSTLSSKKDKILIVAGGGGGSFYEGGTGAIGGSAGGYLGNNGLYHNRGIPYGGSQASGGTNADSSSISGSFGQGGTGPDFSAGGGAGFYGGAAGGTDRSDQGDYGTGAGGSGYIGNTLLTDKAMYCYNCTASFGTDTKTISTICTNAAATKNCSKKGNGYAKISFVKAADVDTRIVKNKEFENINREQTFTAPLSGRYKLEVWGAQGGSYNSSYYGGYGGYSTGIVFLNKNEQLKIYVGSTAISPIGGYNGGGKGSSYVGISGGGGATHIARVSGLLSTLSSKKDKILIVAGGGGGSFYEGGTGAIGGSAGGYLGNNGLYHNRGIPYGGSQASGGTNADSSSISGSFGQGGTGPDFSAGGGAGFYGGAAGGTDRSEQGDYGTGAGGSGYIGNSLLTSKAMYCYNCTASSDTATKTISTTCTNKNATEKCSKQGNGYAKVTYIGE